MTQLNTYNVLNDDDRLIGTVTARDCIEAVVSATDAHGTDAVTVKRANPAPVVVFVSVDPPTTHDAANRVEGFILIPGETVVGTPCGRFLTIVTHDRDRMIFELTAEGFDPSEIIV